MWLILTKFQNIVNFEQKNPKKTISGFAGPLFFCHHQATTFTQHLHPKKNIALDSHNQTNNVNLGECKLLRMRALPN
jgi:hypothetical protein